MLNAPFNKAIRVLPAPLGLTARGTAPFCPAAHGVPTAL